MRNGGCQRKRGGEKCGIGITGSWRRLKVHHGAKHSPHLKLDYICLNFITFKFSLMLGIPSGFFRVNNFNLFCDLFLIEGIVLAQF